MKKAIAKRMYANISTYDTNKQLVTYSALDVSSLHINIFV